ncbi:MAG: hypothetical protein HQ541_16880 [Mariniphaga sp.]|nr:hypothetical protein [Mariniphaga sp.]
MKKILFVATFYLFCIATLTGQNTFSLQVGTAVSEEIQEQFKSNGRLFLFVSSSQSREPRWSTWPNSSNKIFALNVSDWNKKEAFVIDGNTKLTKSVEANLDALPEGKYTVQVLWDQDINESGINAPGNLYSKAISLELNKSTTLQIPLEQLVQPTQFIENEILKLVDIKSDVVSKFWNKEMRIKAAVILPSGYYKNPDKKYPIRYNIAGYGGRYTRAARLTREGSNFHKWWMTDEAPQIINVFLDGEGPFGDCYQLDSDNSGPYGTALIEEVIPYIEKKYRAIGIPESRFLDGCSTGGWVSLALQIFYPDFFNGCFSYSPDQVDFENCQLINIYKDENAFINEFGYLRPIVRNVDGEPRVSQKDFIQFENVLGTSDTYLNSGGQFSAFTALFSPKGENGLPKPMFDPISGVIDREVAKHWEKYDLKLYVENNWETLGPKLQGKLWIWGADMDNFYLNPALRAFDEMLKNMDNPKSDAKISFSAMAGHCSEYDQIEVLKMISNKIKKK